MQRVEATIGDRGQRTRVAACLREARRASYLAGTLLVAAVACRSQADHAVAAFDRPGATTAVAAVLDSLHQHASVADEEAYFGLFAPEAVFFGTDAAERWTVEQFRAWAHQRFATGQGWTYVLRAGTRHVEFDPTGTVAWFDEILDNANYGETRGTGVLRLSDGDWKIAQYHLTIPIPNDIADSVVGMIRSMGQAPTQ